LLSQERLKAALLDAIDDFGESLVPSALARRLGASGPHPIAGTSPAVFIADNDVAGVHDLSGDRHQQDRSCTASMRGRARIAGKSASRNAFAPAPRRRRRHRHSRAG
jgi:hypothetical protein